MDFLELAKQRYSVRRYKQDAVPQELLDKVLEAGRIAPTAHNNQAQRVMAVRSAEGLEKLRRCTECHFNAPVVLVIGYRDDDQWVRPYDGAKSGDVDASIVTTHMMLEAAELGLGTCWVMFFNAEALKAEFEFEAGFEPVALLPLGYPADESHPSRLHSDRKDMGATVSYL